MLVTDLAALLLLSLATASITMTLSKAKIFAWLREWLLVHVPFVGKLLSCPYCTSHWVSLALMILLTSHLPAAVKLSWTLWVICWMANVTLATFWAGLIYRAFHTEGE